MTDIWHLPLSCQFHGHNFILSLKTLEIFCYFGLWINLQSSRKLLELLNFLGNVLVKNVNASILNVHNWFHWSFNKQLGHRKKQTIENYLELIISKISFWPDDTVHNILSKFITQSIKLIQVVQTLIILWDFVKSFSNSSLSELYGRPAFIIKLLG